MKQKDNRAKKVNLSCSFNDITKEPNQPKKINADCRVTIRISHEELNQLKIDAQGTSQSAHIRKCTFGNRTSKRDLPDIDKVLIAQILARLGESRIPNNLNQIAYHANCGSLILDDVTIEEINEACLHVAWIRTQLIEALGLKDRKRKSS